MQIRNRRKELGLTIEEAASRAGVGTKTWCRYEAGGSILASKCKGVCKALNWISFPGKTEEEPSQNILDIHEEHEAWPTY